MIFWTEINKEQNPISKSYKKQKHMATKCGYIGPLWMTDGDSEPELCADSVSDGFETCFSARNSKTHQK